MLFTCIRSQYSSLLHGIETTKQIQGKEGKDQARSTIMPSSSGNAKTTYHLYTFFSSSCAARLRIALNLKNIEYVPHYVDMRADDHESETYLKLNPSASIPTLVIETEGQDTLTIGQSVAMLEYLEEVHPTQTPLLPPASDPKARARVRELLYIVTSDIFPPTNSRIAQSVKAVRGERGEFSFYCLLTFEICSLSLSRTHSN